MLLLIENIQQKFIKDEEFAKENKLGMWSMKFQYPWDFRKASLINYLSNQVVCDVAYN